MNPSPSRAALNIVARRVAVASSTRNRVNGTIATAQNFVDVKTLERCLESLGVCHLQDEPRWAAARVVAQQDIDEFIKAAGPTAPERHRALARLMEEFARRFPDETDPVLIRSYMRGQMRRIGYELQRDEPSETGIDLQTDPVARALPD